MTTPAGSYTFRYEITSASSGFSDLQFGKVEIKLRAWEESVDLRIFVFNPDGSGHDTDAGAPNYGYNSVPDAATLLDHHHILDDTLPDNHKHSENHDDEPHTHDALIDETGDEIDLNNLHFHGKGAQPQHYKYHHLRPSAASPP